MLINFMFFGKLRKSGGRKILKGGRGGLFHEQELFMVCKALKEASKSLKTYNYLLFCHYDNVVRSEILSQGIYTVLPCALNPYT